MGILPMYRILIAEREQQPGEQLHLKLAPAFVVDRVNNGRQACESARISQYDAFVLDYDLPFSNCLEMCQQLKGVSPNSAIVVLGTFPDDDERADVISYGADQYICKPVSITELSARLYAVIRRLQPQGYLQLVLGNGVTLERTSGLLSNGSKQVRLRHRERALLEFFLRNPNRLLSAEVLWNNVWMQKGIPSDTIRAHINMLRRKLREFDCHTMIKTVHGFGYRFDSSENAYRRGSDFDGAQASSQ
jgi:DNA-binding response OmpR family regulator